MMRPHLAALFASGASIFLATLATANTSIPVIVEAENAVLGSSFTSATDGDVSYIASSETFTGSAPDSEVTLASFPVTFSEGGEYELFARIYIGPQGASDDSLIFASRFDATLGSSDDWSMANNLTNVGFVAPNDMILSTGDAGGQVWKWIRVSAFTDVGLFVVPDNELTQSYKISSREDGLRLDKIAFAQRGVSFTVDQLDKGLAGTDYRQPGDGEPFQATGPVLAHNKSKFLGSVWSGTSDYNEDFEFYWDGMWHGNAGKWGTVERDRDSMNWDVLDEGYEFAKANDVEFNFHVLLWGAQQPDWISNLEPDEQLEEIKEWMAAVAERYPDIDYLQVVNEPINAPPNGGQGSQSDSARANYSRALGGAGETGFDWILEGFRLARHYFPDTPLMINEYGIEGNHDMADQYLEIIQALQEENLIDLVGFQGHAFSTKGPSAADMRAILDQIASTGLPIMITEMEIDGFDDLVQLEEYKRVFPIYWDHPSVIGINISGHIGNWRADRGAVLVNEDFSERLALKWMRDYVAESPWHDFDGYLESRTLDGSQHTFAADVDGDGLATGFEYLLDSDPQTPEISGLDFSRLNGTIEISVPAALHALKGHVHIESSEDLKTWQKIASFDLNLRQGDGFELIDGQNVKTLLYTESIPQTPQTFYRCTYERTD